MKVGVLAVLCGAGLLPSLASAESIPGSDAQVGAWRVTAYTRGAAGPFDHCSLYRIQSQGFGLGVGYTVHGVWTIGAEAPDWGLTAKESYTATLQVGGTPYTATGRALTTR